MGSKGGGSNLQSQSLNPELDQRLLELQIQGAESQLALFDQTGPLRNSFINTANAFTQSGTPQTNVNSRLLEIPGLIDQLTQEQQGLAPTTTSIETVGAPSNIPAPFAQDRTGRVPDRGFGTPGTQEVQTTIDNPRIAEIEDLLGQLSTEQSLLTQTSRFSNEDFGLQKQGIEAQFDNAEQALKASLPPGGALISQLAELEQVKARALQGAFGARFDDERNIALALSTGSPQFLQAGLNTVSQQQASLAQQNALALSASNAQQQAQAQQKSSLGQAVGTLGAATILK